MKKDGVQVYKAGIGMLLLLILLMTMMIWANRPITQLHKNYHQQDLYVHAFAEGECRIYRIPVGSSEGQALSVLLAEISLRRSFPAQKGGDYEEYDVYVEGADGVLRRVCFWPGSRRVLVDRTEACLINWGESEEKAFYDTLRGILWDAEEYLQKTIPF